MLNQKNKILFLTFFLLLLGNLKSNGQGNLPFADNKKVHFGFSLGLNFPDFAVIPTDREKNVSVTQVLPGFCVGAITDFRLNKYFNLRFTPQLILNQRTINFYNNTKEDVLSIPMFLPLYLKYSSVRNGNFRPYLIAGAGAWIDWGRNKDKTVLLRPFDVLLEMGAGCDIYFSFFKLAPELKFSLGLNNMLTPLKNRDAGALLHKNTIIHTNSINKLTTRMISLTFHFE